MRGLDRHAIERLGIPGATLMENAGRGAAEAILQELRGARRTPRGACVVVVCGKGGNGGDGFVVARRLAQAGVRVQVLLTSPAAEITGDAASKFRALRGRAPGACPQHGVHDEIGRGERRVEPAVVVE